VETIRSAGCIDGADSSVAALTGRNEVRIADQVLVSQAINGDPCMLAFGYLPQMPDEERRCYHFAAINRTTRFTRVWGHREESRWILAVLAHAASERPGRRRLLVRAPAGFAGDFAKPCEWPWGLPWPRPLPPPWPPP